MKKCSIAVCCNIYPCRLHFMSQTCSYTLSKGIPYREMSFDGDLIIFALLINMLLGQQVRVVEVEWRTVHG